MVVDYRQTPTACMVDVKCIEDLLKEAGVVAKKEELNRQNEKYAGRKVF